MILTVETIRKVFKRPDLNNQFCEELIYCLDTYGETFNIITDLHIVRFLSQAVHETMINKNGNVRFRENLNYSVKGLIKISLYFRTHLTLAELYGRSFGRLANQEKIANIFYADENRSPSLRLGNTEKGDGWKFRGSGIFQTTGRENTVKDINWVHKKVPLIVADEDYNVYEDGISFILLGMAHWDRKQMYICHNTKCVTNKINKGLSAHKKKDRLRTALRVKALLEQGKEYDVHHI